MLAVVVTLVVAELAARLVSSGIPPALRWYDATAQLKIEQMESRGEVDVVFAGTSMSWQGLVPEVYARTGGVSAYNASLAGGVPPVMERWLLEEVEPRLSPSLLVWGISSLDLSPSYGAENRERYDDALEARSGMLASVERLTAQHSVLVRNRTVLRDPSQAWGGAARARQASFDTAREVLGADGERLDFTVDVSAERGAVQQARLRDFSLDPDDVRSIERTIEELRTRGVEVVLLEMPVPDRFVASHPNGSSDHALVRRALSSVAQLHDVRFISPTTEFTGEDFVDFTHLGQAASHEFTRMVAEAVGSGRDDARAEFRDVGQISGPDGGENCREELVVDEYGIATEIEVCEGAAQPGPAPVRASSLDEWLETSSAIEFAEFVADRLTFQTGCGASPTPDVRLDQALDTLPDSFDTDVVTTLVDTLGRMDAACLSRADGWRVELEIAVTQVGALAEQLGAARIPDPDYRTDDITERTARAVAVADHLYSWVAGRDEVEASLFWFSAADLRFGTQTLEASRTNSPPGTIVTGSSIAARALDPQALATAFGTPVLNLAMPGAPPESAALWLPDWVEMTGSTDVVWGISTHRLMSSPERCASLQSGTRARAATAPLDARSRLFAPVPVVNTHQPLEIALGPDAGAAYDGTSLGKVLETEWDAGGLIPKDTAFAGVSERHRGFYIRNIACAAVFDALFENIADLREDGVEVVLALLPQHEQVRAINIDLIEELERLLRRGAADNDVRLLELPGPLTDTETYDGVHSTRAGRDRLTNELVAALER